MWRIKFALKSWKVPKYFRQHWRFMQQLFHSILWNSWEDTVCQLCIMIFIQLGWVTQTKTIHFSSFSFFYFWDNSYDLKNKKWYSISFINFPISSVNDSILVFSLLNRFLPNNLHFCANCSSMFSTWFSKYSKTSPRLFFAQHKKLRTIS